MILTLSRHDRVWGAVKQALSQVRAHWTIFTQLYFNGVAVVPTNLGLTLAVKSQPAAEAYGTNN